MIGRGAVVTRLTCELALFVDRGSEVVDERGASRLRPGGALCDVGPTVMRLLGLDLPAEMTGTDLREGGGRS